LESTLMTQTECSLSLIQNPITVYQFWGTLHMQKPARLEISIPHFLFSYMRPPLHNSHHSLESDKRVRKLLPAYERSLFIRKFVYHFLVSFMELAAPYNRRAPHTHTHTHARREEGNFSCHIK
jgi:hypothetical protein